MALGRGSGLSDTDYRTGFDKVSGREHNRDDNRRQEHLVGAGVNVYDSTGNNEHGGGHNQHGRGVYLEYNGILYFELDTSASFHELHHHGGILTGTAGDGIRIILDHEFIIRLDGTKHARQRGFYYRNLLNCPDHHDFKRGLSVLQHAQLRE